MGYAPSRDLAWMGHISPRRPSMTTVAACNRSSMRGRRRPPKPGDLTAKHSTLLLVTVDPLRPHLVRVLARRGHLHWRRRPATRPWPQLGQHAAPEPVLFGEKRSRYDNEREIVYPMLPVSVGPPSPSWCSPAAPPGVFVRLSD
jgi:hypothetical protein